MSTKQLISLLQRYTHAEHVLPVGRGALGIYVALKAWAQEDDLLVAMPASVCQDVVAAVLMAGCKPFFCDVDLTTGLVAEDEWRKAKSAGAKVVIVVHLYGNLADTLCIRQIFPKVECLLIDDAAQALGARTIKALAGTEGDVGILSFGATKHIEVGGAAMLFQDQPLAQRSLEIITSLRASDQNTRVDTQKVFRKGYERARTRLIQTGDYGGFSGLLEGYFPLLQVQWQENWAEEIINKLENYSNALDLRQKKTVIWREGISGTDLIPVGMDTSAGCAPWRFACRWINCESFGQLYQMGDSLRRAGLNVSHWYLPANWWLAASDQHMPCSEKLAKQAIQFWLDSQTSIETIERSITIVKDRLLNAPIINTN